MFPDSVCDYQTSQLVHEVDRRARHNLTISVAGEPVDKELIDLYLDRGDVLKVGRRGRAGTEIVDLDARTGGPRRAQLESDPS